jgi:hypothetical protein
MIEVRIPLYQRTTLRFFKPRVKIKGRRETRGGNKMSLVTNRVITEHMHNCPKKREDVMMFPTIRKKGIFGCQKAPHTSHFFYIYLFKYQIVSQLT